jgi:hypothetical protein
MGVQAGTVHGENTGDGSGSSHMQEGRHPDWWDWELELSPHLCRRMLDRGFSELDLRAMLEDARTYRSDTVEGRWVIIASHERKTWEAIVEPDSVNLRLVVVTAYPCWEPEDE